MGKVRKRTSLPGDEIAGWRVDRLAGAGFSARLAERLAADPRYDLHALLELIDRGCPPELAARILAPIDREQQR